MKINQGYIWHWTFAYLNKIMSSEIDHLERERKENWLFSFNISVDNHNHGETGGQLVNIEIPHTQIYSSTEE